MFIYVVGSQYILDVSFFSFEHLLLPYESILCLYTMATMLTICRMWLNLSAIFRRLSHDPNVRSIVMTGAGDRAFTAGLDVKVC